MTDTVKIWQDGKVLEMSREEAQLPSPEEALAAWRKVAVMSRTDFCIAAARAGMLTKQEAKLAAKGDWPDAFADALAGLPEGMDPDEAEIAWAGATEVHRLNPLLLAVADHKNIGAEQLDSLFGG